MNIKIAVSLSEEFRRFDLKITGDVEHNFSFEVEPGFWLDFDRLPEDGSDIERDIKRCVRKGPPCAR